MPKRTNIIVGCIYRHPDNDIDDLTQTTQSLSSKNYLKNRQKITFLLGDFNIALFKFNSCSSVCNFLDELSSSYFFLLFLVNKCFNDEAFSLFSNHFKLTASSHSYCTRSVSNGLIFKRLYNTIRYGNKSIISSTVRTLNHFQTVFHGHNLLNMSQKK